MKKVFNILKKVVILGHPNAQLANIMNSSGDKNGFFGYNVKNKSCY